MGYATASEFVRLLRPAWWVLRGYLAAMLVVVLLDEDSRLGLLPRLGGSTIAALVLLAVFIWLSIRLGRRSDRLSRWPRRVVFAGGALLLIMAVVGFVNADQRARHGQLEYVTVHDDRASSIQDIYVYDSQGRPLTDVWLLDQDGRPLELGWWRCERPLLAAKEAYLAQRLGRLTYPHCPQYAPLPAPPAPTAPPSPTSPGPGPSPTG
jgi:hypothetical protein